MALLVTLFLVLVNIFNSVTATAPKSEGLTAVEIWVVSGIIHVFGVLAEYAIILKMIQNDKLRCKVTNYLHSPLFINFLLTLISLYYLLTRLNYFFISASCLCLEKEESI